MRSSFITHKTVCGGCLCHFPQFAKLKSVNFTTSRMTDMQMMNVDTTALTGFNFSHAHILGIREKDPMKRGKELKGVTEWLRVTSDWKALDLSGTGGHFEQATLHRVNLQSSRLASCNFDGTTLSFCDLEGENPFPFYLQCIGIANSRLVARSNIESRSWLPFSSNFDHSGGHEPSHQRRQSNRCCTARR